MPQKIRQAIGFDERDLNRLRYLTEEMCASQREIIAALIRLPDEDVRQAVAQLKESERSRKHEIANAAKALKKGNLTQEQLAKIREILGDDASN